MHVSANGYLSLTVNNAFSKCLNGTSLCYVDDIHWPIRQVVTVAKNKMTCQDTRLQPLLEMAQISNHQTGWCSKDVVRDVA